jgi:hypothetical protein
LHGFKYGGKDTVAIAVQGRNLSAHVKSEWLQGTTLTLVSSRQRATTYHAPDRSHLSKQRELCEVQAQAREPPSAMFLFPQAQQTCA